MRKGEIWFVEMPTSNGHEQTGHRPAIVISEVEADIAIIVPITSNLQALRFPHTVEINPTKQNGLKTQSIALIFQIRAIDKKRLKNKIGQVENTHIKEIDRITKQILNL